MVFFLGFVFFIVIVLMNLLNALAVADAKEMLEDADLEMLHGLLTTVAFWEKVVQGDPGNRLRWCLLPLKDMVGSSWWPVRPATLSVLSPTPVLRFLPKTNKTWKDEFPNDVFWLCQVRQGVSFPHHLKCSEGAGLEQTESEGAGDEQGLGGGDDHQERLGKG